MREVRAEGGGGMVAGMLGCRFLAGYLGGRVERDGFSELVARSDWLLES